MNNNNNCNNNRYNNFETIIIKNQNIPQEAKSHILHKTFDTTSEQKKYDMYISNFSKNFECFEKNVKSIIIKNLISNTVLMSNDKMGSILNKFIKELFYDLQNYFLEENIVKTQVKKVLNLLSNKFKMEKVLLKQKNIIKSMWFLYVDAEVYELKRIKNRNNSHSTLLNKKPLKWIYYDKSKVVNDQDSSLNSKGIFMESCHIQSLYNKHLVDMINQKQEVFHYIDKELFELTFKQHDVTTFFKKKAFNINKEIPNYWSHVEENFENYNSIIKDKYGKKTYRWIDWEDFIKNKIKYKSFIEDNKLTKIINPELIEVLNFIYNYKGEKIYNQINCDHRGRMYIKSYISYISSKLYRFLICLKDDKDKSNNLNSLKYLKYYSSITLNKNIESIEEAIKYYDENNLKDFISNNMYFNKINVYKRSTISLDATSSMLQIIALLTKEKKMMKYTNLTKQNKRFDIHNYLISILYEENKESIFIDYFKNRKLVKYCIMTNIYGSTPLYTAKTLYEEFGVKSIMQKDLAKIISKILSTFNKEFKSVNILRNAVKTYIKRRNDKNVSFKTITKTIKHSNPKENTWKVKTKLNDKEHLNVKINFKTSKNDYKKALRSTFVNIIHSIDSEICLLTTQSLRIKGINCLSIHDCFITNIENYGEVLKEYNKSLKQVWNINIETILENFIDVLDEKSYTEYKKKTESYEKQTENIKHEELQYTLKPE